MNRRGREQISEALSLFRRGASIIERVRDREQDSVDNYPENLQGTQQFEKMEVSLECLDKAVDILASVEETIENVLGELEELEENLKSAVL